MAPESRGSISLLTLCLISALGVAVGSYFALLTQTQRLGARQFQNDRVRELAEAALEEALWSLNQNNWTSSGPAGNSAWTTSGGDRTVTLDYGSLGQGATGQVNLAVRNYASAGPTWPTIDVEAVVTLADGRVARRKLQAATAPAPLFGNAIASVNKGVAFVAGGTVDSWNSDPDNNPATAAVPYSFTAGNSANYAAVVAGRDNGAGYGVVLTQASVKGYVATFGQPVSYSTSSSPPGKVQGPATGPTVNIDPARLSRSAFVPGASVFTVVTPPTGGANYGGLLSGILGLVNAITSSLLSIDLFKVSGDMTILGIPLVSPNLTVDRPLSIIITGDLSITNSGKITITPSGSLQLFVAGDVTIGGNGIDNQTNDPSKCVIFATDGSTSDSLQYTSSSNFCGVIYCENKPIDIRQNATFYGALLSGQQVGFSTGATAPIFHYDTALRTKRFTQVTTPYVLSRITPL
jgi:hypothetical protein